MDDDASLMDHLTSLRLGVIALAAGTLIFATERVWITMVAEGPSLPMRSAVGWWGANVGIALLITLLGSVAAGLASLIKHERLRIVAGAALFAVLSSGLAAPLGAELAEGGWIGQQSWAGAVRYLPAAGIGIGCGALYLLVSTLRERPGNLLGVALVAAGLALVCVDHLVLLGTYPDLHLTLHLAIAATVSAGFAAIGWRVDGHGARVVATLSIFVAAAVPALWATTPLGYRPQLSMTSSMANVLMERTMPRITLEVAEREFATVDLSKGSYLPEPRGDALERNDWNVLWITVDTLRWDALWPSRAAKGHSFAQPGDTPFLDEWLRSAVVFEHVYSQSSATHCSMPPMFKSLEAHEKTLITGTPLGEAAARAGRTSIAVVNNFFLEPRFKRSQSLLWGFDEVEVYHKKQQDELVGLLDGAIGRNEESFFAWAHFYNMHAPGYGAKGLQSTKGSTWDGRYRISLQWLDARMKEIIENLEKRGLADRTIIVFSADHAESLGANRIQSHGPTIYEEEVRVPLAIKIPGLEPRVVSTTVGNIDIVPTLWDAMALEPEVTHRGRSLLPAMLGEPIADVPYYMQNRFGDMIGLVIGDQKLVQKTKSGTTMRFDLAADPTEDQNLFEDGPDDQPVLAGLYARDPALVVATPMMGEVAVSLLDSTNPNNPGSALPYVLNIAARSEAATAADEMVRLFRRTNSDRIKLEVVRALEEVNSDRIADLLTDELRDMAPDREAKFVRGLAAIAADGIEYSFVEARFSGELPPDSVVTAWARWLRGWEEPAVGSVLTNLASKLAGRAHADAMTLAAVCDLIVEARLSEAEQAQLATFPRSHLTHAEPRVRVAAMRAAAALKDAESFQAISELAEASHVQVRQAALHALAEIDGERAVDIIATAGKDPNLTLDAVRAMEKTRSARGVPFVKHVSRTHYNSFIRALALRSLKRLEKHVARAR